MILRVKKKSTEFELDDASDLTVVMSAQEREAILAVDAAFADRAPVNERPTVVMAAVKVG